jgi:hypothetical protein
MTMTKTRGEEVFEEYLTSLGLRYTYEPPIGNRRPDFLVHSPSGDVICEVKDFELNDEERAELAAIVAGRHNTVSSREIPFDRIQLKIRAASRQLREFKGRYPCLVVLFDASAQVHLIDLTVLGAMYGKTLISVPIRLDGDDREAESSIVFEHESRYLTRNSNTTVSAVAILQHVAPKQRLLDEALAKQDLDGGSDRVSEILRFAYEFGEQHPEIFDRVPRLHVFRNMFAAVPWPAEALNGPHDLLWPTAEGSR